MDRMNKNSSSQPKPALNYKLAMQETHKLLALFLLVEILIRLTYSQVTGQDDMMMHQHMSHAVTTSTPKWTLVISPFPSAMVSSSGSVRPAHSHWKAQEPSIFYVDIRSTENSAFANTSVLISPGLSLLDDRLVHFMLFSSNYDAMMHVHPEDFSELLSINSASPSSLMINLTFPSSGEWVIGASFLPRNVDAIQTAVASIRVSAAGEGNEIQSEVFKENEIRQMLVRAREFENNERYIYPIFRKDNVIEGEAITEANENRMFHLSVEIMPLHYLEPMQQSLFIDLGQPTVVHKKIDRTPTLYVNECLRIVITVANAYGIETAQLMPYLGLPVHVALFHFNHTTGQYIFQHIHGKVYGIMDRNMNTNKCMHQHAMMTNSVLPDTERFGPSVITNTMLEVPGRWMLAAQLRHDDKKDGQLITLMTDINIYEYPPL